VFFSSAYSRDVTLDGRTHYSIIKNEHLGIVQQNGVVSSTNAGIGSFIILISFPTHSSANQLNTTIELKIIQYTNLEIVTYPYPQYINSFSRPEILHRVHCSNVYQRASVKIIATASNGHQSDVSSKGTLVSADESIVQISSSKILIPQKVGILTIFATYGGKVSNVIEISVTDDTIGINSISERTFTNGEFHDMIYTNRTLIIDVTMEDGTFYEDALNIEWLQIYQNFYYSLGNPSLTSHEGGHVQILGNW
jgi:hypothetical protein